MHVDTLSQFLIIYNTFSFTLAAMGAATLFFWFGRSQVAPAYKTALTITGLVTAIAAYHYFRIFDSWNAAYALHADGISGTDHPFNDAYRYVDWLLTVPLLLIEIVLVMRLDRRESVAKATQLGLAAALMIILGYPGEIAATNSGRALWGTLSTIPFLYIVYELFRGLGASIERQPVEVRDLVKKARLLTFASWGFYPIVYMIPYTHFTGGSVEVGLQLGYSIADLASKVGVGLLIYNIAVRKSEVETGVALAH